MVENILFLRNYLNRAWLVKYSKILYENIIFCFKKTTLFLKYIPIPDLKDAYWTNKELHALT